MKKNEYLNAACGTILSPAHITLKTTVGICEHKIYGYALYSENDNTICLYHADFRRKPAMKVPCDNVLSLVAEYI